MKVSELISLLQTLNPETEVLIYNEEEDEDISLSRAQHIFMIEDKDAIVFDGSLDAEALCPHSDAAKHLAKVLKS